MALRENPHGKPSFERKMIHTKWDILEKELKEISVERVTLVSRIVEYLFEKELDSMTETIEYLKEQLGIK